MNKRFNIDIETACDETVLHRTNYRNKKEYEDAILRTVELSQNHRILLSTHFSENSCTVRKRLDKILVYRKRHKGVALCTSIMTLLLCTGTLIGITPGVQAQANANSSIYDLIKDKQVVRYVKYTFLL